MLNRILKQYQPFQPVVLFDPAKDKLLSMDFTSANTALTQEILTDVTRFKDYVNQELSAHQSPFGIGGYGENRTIYSRNTHFDTADEPRTVHLGVDIWGPVGTTVYAPLNGHIHSFKYNEGQGDYGATIILRHQLEAFTFHTLYGHLSLADLRGLQVNDMIMAGQPIAHFGDIHENGQWAPHLHFQLIIDMEGKQGDYPGVCKYSERERYLANCPDPSLILQVI
jgi:peptidoglycan LD-endopeptidase LytH